MKQFVLFVAMILSLCINGQIKSAANSDLSQRKFKLGITFSPDICYRTLKNNNGTAPDNVLKLRNETETPKFGYTTGLNLYITVKSFLEIQTGIQYSNKGYQTKKMDLTWEQPSTSLPTKSKSIYNFHYIDIPLRVNLTIGKSKFRFITGAGLTTNILINQSQTNILEYAGGREDRNKKSTTVASNKIDISPTISAGLDYRINAKSNLRCEPTFRYGIININDSQITERLWTCGLNIIYCFRL